MFFLNRRSNFEKKPHELSYRSNRIYVFLESKENGNIFKNGKAEASNR